MTEAQKSVRFRRLRGFIAGGALLFAASAALMVADAWVPFGAAATGERRARMEASKQWAGNGFENPQPLYNDYAGWIDADGSDHASPDGPIPFEKVPAARFSSAPESGLRVTWLGHSSTLIEVDGARVLTDPVWGERASPYTWVGPKRWYPPPLALDDVPKLDAVVISHDHYDHLDYPTIEAMRDWDTTFIVPLGVGAHLEYWGVPAARIVELDWWETHELGNVTVACTPARHASGRQVFDQNATLWAGYALLGPEHRVFFSGDTGLFPGMKDIGERYGPFDVTMVEVGAYHQSWPDWHIGPEQAVQAHTWLRGRVFLPIHWGLFDLALHGWTEPIERTLIAADDAGVLAVSPRPGGSVEPTLLGPSSKTDRWWPAVPFQTAAEHPVVSTKID